MLAAAVAARTAEIVQALAALDDEDLVGPSRLEGWSRLTIACHLRYGARTLSRMTEDVIAGRRTSYYPAGREHQRPATLTPDRGETPGEVVHSLAENGQLLDARWASLATEHWALPFREPDGNPDLGALPLVDLALLRLTEVEVHGSDLDVGLGRWSDLFVKEALPFRLDRLNARRAGDEIEGSWLLVASGGPTYLVRVEDTVVVSRPASPATPASAVITASSRDILALLLGRPATGAVHINGDVTLGRAFGAILPGP